MSSVFDSTTQLALVTRVGHIQGRNLLINGNFRTNQRAYVSAASLTSGTYAFDRWKATTASTTLTYTVAPQGQALTINADKSIAQVIERASIPAGTYILSWTGTATGRVYNSGGSVPSYGISGLTAVIDGTADVVVEFSTPAGTTATLSLAQLEEGSVATPFEVISLADELALCQRYYFKVTATGGVAICPGIQFSTTSAECYLPLPVSMRTTPTLSLSSCYFSDRVTFGNLATAGAVSHLSASGMAAFAVTFTAAGAQFRAGSLYNGGGTSVLTLTAEL